MTIFGLLFGLFIIGIGFFVKKYPDTISGYNTMSTQKKKNVDIESIASLYKKGLIIIGLVIMICSSFFSLLKLPELEATALPVPLLIGMFVLTVLAQKYDHNKQSRFKKRLPVIIVGVIILIVSFSLYYNTRPTNVIVSDNSIEFTGAYGLTIPMAQIEKAELLDNIPEIKMRTNGLGLGGILKGHFILDELGKCRLLLRLPNSPFLYLQLKNGEKIMFNSPDSLYTKDVYNALKERLY